MTTHNSSPRIFVTGATGQLGRKVIDALLQRVPATSVVAGVRDMSKAAELQAHGVEARVADYDKPETLTAALRGIDRLLLISGNAVGQRTRQHTAVIAAAKAAGVKLIAYTSILRADESKVGLAVEHKATEAALAASGVPHVLLRNGWYLENFAGRATTALQTGTLLTCAGDGRFSAAPRADYAAAAATVLASATGHAGERLELAGSTSFSMPELAALITRVSGKPVACNNLSSADYAAALMKGGLPDFVAAILSSSDAAATTGWLQDDSRTLEKLIGSPTTPLKTVIEGVVRAAG
ncbi:MAG: NmrA family NAD(P)-binding protein [Pseudomonadota bacterium]